MLGRVDQEEVHLAQRFAGEGMDLADALDLVPEELHPHRVRGVGGVDLQHVAAHPEMGPFQHGVVALVQQAHQPPPGILRVQALPDGELQAHFPVVAGVADAVDAGHGGHHDHVAPLQQRGGGRQAQAVDLLVDRGVLFDVQVLARNVGLGLVVVVVGDEILHRVFGEEILELAVELGGQGLVVGDDQGGQLGLLDDLGHGEGLAGAGDPLQGLGLVPGPQAPGQGLDGLGLVAGRLEAGHDLELLHHCRFCGRSESLMARVWALRLRRILTSTVSPGLLSSRAPSRSYSELTGILSTSTMMSPPR